MEFKKRKRKDIIMDVIYRGDILLIRKYDIKVAEIARE